MEGESSPHILVALLVLDEPSGFLNEGWRDALAVAALSLTIVGFVAAISQIMRVATSAQAALEATTSAREELSRNLRLADASSAVRLIGEIKALVTSEQLDAARLRLSDLLELLVQIRATGSYEVEDARQFQDSVAQVSSLERALLRQHHGTGKPVDPMQIHTKLREVSNFLNTLATTTRLETGGADADS